MRVIINSVPKSGTHLVEKALRLLGVSAGEPLFVSSATAEGLLPLDGELRVKIGVGMPVEVSAARLREKLMSMAPLQVATAHIVYSREMEELLSGADFRMLLALRDPRDVAVSLAFHIAREKAHRLHEQFVAMSADERLMAAIRGCGKELESVRERFESVMPWLDWPGTMRVRFEDLVGAAGGGSDTAQERTLRAMCVHIRCAAPADLQTVSKSLFGGSATFRQGTTGQWREQFTAEHQRAFDEVAPGLLERLGY